MTHPYEAPASAALFERARTVIPGGVNSPVRAFQAVGGTPRFMASGRGPYLTDVDGREYVDLVCSWGPIILGHAHPAVVEAVTRAQAALGELLGAIPVLRTNIEHSHEQHDTIVAAILTGDPDTARTTMEEHCDATSALLRGLLG